MNSFAKSYVFITRILSLIYIDFVAIIPSQMPVPVLTGKIHISGNENRRELSSRVQKKGGKDFEKIGTKIN